jgi:predicted PurR-regulated permease PerM
MDSNKNINITITPGTIFKTLFIVSLFAFLFLIKDVVLVVLTAIVIASAVEPIVLWFKKVKIGRLPAVIVSYVVFALLFISIFYFFIPSLLQDTANFLNSAPSYLNSTSVWNPLNKEFEINEKNAIVSFSHNLTKGLQSANSISKQGLSLSEVVSWISSTFSNISEGAVKLLSVVFGGIFAFILIIVLSFYLSVQEDGIARFLRIITPVANEKYVIDLWRRVQMKIGYWFQGQLLLGILVGILVYLGLTIFGVRNALFLAALAAIFEVIPLFGPIMSAIPAIMIAYVEGGIVKSLLIAGFYTIVQQFENHLIYPLVVKKVTGVPPILVILSLVVGGKLAGFLGIILSVPVAATLVELIDDLQKTKFKNS